jgi:hypothetical protein
LRFRVRFCLSSGVPPSLRLQILVVVPGAGDRIYFSSRRRLDDPAQDFRVVEPTSVEPSEFRLGVATPGGWFRPVETP